MVVAHSGAPRLLNEAIYTFHMPLFFIASGWFFHERSMDDIRGFAIRKLKSIYWPYWKWCVIFLLFHNVFYSFGILNDSYGYKGYVSQLYSTKDMAFRAVNFTLRMAGYEDFLLGAYWFVRSLLWGSLLCYYVSSQL